MVLPVVPVSGLVSGLPQPGSNQPVGSTPIRVTVGQNAPETVIDLRAAFGAMGGTQSGVGLKLSILGNTNFGLVKTDLSGAALTLTYAAGKSGTATITVAATNADGVSMKQTIQITVVPLSVVGVIPISPILTGLQSPTMPGSSR
jgi:hypothetical protein